MFSALTISGLTRCRRTPSSAPAVAGQPATRVSVIISLIPMMIGPAMTFSSGLKALLWWGLFLTLTLLNPTPTGGATLVAGPVGVMTIYATKDWIFGRNCEAHEEAEESYQEAAEATS